MRWWIGMLAVVGAVAAGREAAVHAQSPPTRAFGTVTIDGQPAPLGTIVQAYIDDQLCGEGMVRRVNDDLPQGYVVDVAGAAQTPGCAGEGDTITFRIGGVKANETGTFATGSFLRLDLTV